MYILAIKHTFLWVYPKCSKSIFLLQHRYASLRPSHRPPQEDTRYNSLQPPPYQGSPSKRGMKEERVTIEKTTTVEGTPSAMTRVERDTVEEPKQRGTPQNQSQQTPKEEYYYDGSRTAEKYAPPADLPDNRESE